MVNNGIKHFWSQALKSDILHCYLTQRPNDPSYFELYALCSAVSSECFVVRPYDSRLTVYD